MSKNKILDEAMKKLKDQKAGDEETETGSSGDGSGDIKLTAGVFTITISMSQIMADLTWLAELTGANNLNTAMDLIWFKIPTAADISTAAKAQRMRLGLLQTVWKCQLDGNVKPPVDLYSLYQSILASEAAPIPDITPWHSRGPGGR